MENSEQEKLFAVQRCRGGMMSRDDVTLCCNLSLFVCLGFGSQAGL